MKNYEDYMGSSPMRDGAEIRDCLDDDRVTYIDSVVADVLVYVKDKYLARYYALLILTKGTEITLSDIHDAWAMNMNYKPKNEHCYGHEHKSIVPFEKLDADVQAKDEKFLNRLIGIAKIVKENKRYHA